MTTIDRIRRDGWIEVERLQGELVSLREKWGDGYNLQPLLAETEGRIKGMVSILNILG